MKTSVIGYPRIGQNRELKFCEERYFRGEACVDELQSTAAALRRANWETQRAQGIDFIPSNDFSLYDNMLDTAVLLNAVPARFIGSNTGSSAGLDAYFAMARGFQGPGGDVHALRMKKWFNTNYHYIVPELGPDTRLRLAGEKPFCEYLEAKHAGIETKPVIIGPYTFLKLSGYAPGVSPRDFARDISRAYGGILSRFDSLCAGWVALDEPALVLDMDAEDLSLFAEAYNGVLSQKGGVRVLLQTYFGDVRDCYSQLIKMNFDGIGLDFVDGARSLALIEELGFPREKTLFAGLINGKNVWRADMCRVSELARILSRHCPELVVSASCSFLHLPCSLENENGIPAKIKSRLAFAREKLCELGELNKILSSPDFIRGDSAGCDVPAQKGFPARSDFPSPSELTRLPAFSERERLQKIKLALPLLPTTTIGSFPQTDDVRKARAALNNGGLSRLEYDAFIREKTAQCVRLQEALGLDVLVHGEFERCDMVEFFARSLDGFLFTDGGWVQSYGTRCVKPPIIHGDISRSRPITVDFAVYAQSLTKKYVKGMLTGPVTILNWSFPREDISAAQCAFQIARSIRAETADLEAAGIKIIQIDEAALREKLPLRACDRESGYLGWAIAAFRLCHSGVSAETQIHTHMCYSEFSDILSYIEAMDADVITFEAARSGLSLLESLRSSGFKTQVGPGVYDIHSPRVPGRSELLEAINKMLAALPSQKLWVNPDCGLKTRGWEETLKSLENMVAATREARKQIRESSEAEFTGDN